MLIAAIAFPALGDVGETIAYLLPDSDGRYRPAVDAKGAVTVLADIDSITPPAVSPDGTKVAFSGAVGDESLGLYALFVVNVDGSGLTQLTQGKFGEFDPAWSPDGQTIAVAQNPSGALSACCRLVSVDAGSGVETILSPTTGVARPSYSGDGSFIVYDTASGVFRVSYDGGSSSFLASGGFDASVAPDNQKVVYLTINGAFHEIRTVSASGGSVVTIYSTTDGLENPAWIDNRIVFTQYAGLGYDGRLNVRLISIDESGGDLKIERSFSNGVVGVSPGRGNDELFFYRDDGLFRFYEIRFDASLPTPMLAGDGYTSGWSSITSVDLDGDGQDEMFFYRDDGLFRYYHVREDGTLPSPLLAGDGYTSGWSSITSVDLDGDGQDEMFFYRDDGLFRYYHVRPDGTLPEPLLAGSGYSIGWSAITAVDLDGDGQDEMFFYRDDGLYRFYNIKADGTLGVALSGGTDFETSWDSIAAIDIDGDRRDELFFYRTTGEFAYYDVGVDGQLGNLILGGPNYTAGWSNITSVDIRPG